jgi:cytoskeleton protein RodZ
MTSIGETLRRERIKRNLDLNQISRETKISARLLEAIEAEQFDKLPGGVFAKSFVRQYARVLGLDEDELAAEMDRAFQPEVPVPEGGHSHEAAPEVPRVENWQGTGSEGFRWSSTLPALALVVVVMLVCSGVYALWQRSRTRSMAMQENPPVAQTTHPASQPVANPAAGAGQVPGAAPQPGVAEPAAGQAPGSATAANGQSPLAANQTPDQQPGGTANRAQASPETESKPEAQPPATSKLPVQQPVPNATVHVRLRAIEESWVKVVVDGKYLFSGTLQANETRTVEAAGAVLVRMGNAGGVAVQHNGKELGAVGPKGQVRTVQFTSGGFQVVPPAAPPAAPKPPAAATDPL